MPRAGFEWMVEKVADDVVGAAAELAGPFDAGFVGVDTNDLARLVCRQRACQLALAASDIQHPSFDCRKSSQNEGVVVDVPIPAVVHASEATGVKAKRSLS